MVTEEGVIVKVKEDSVLVQPERSDRCEGCSAAFCATDESGDLIIEARDPIGAKVGQRIRLVIREERLIGYSFLLYGFPLISLLVGAFGGTWIGGLLGLGSGTDVLAVGSALGLTVMALLFSKTLVRKLETSKSYQPVVVEILNGGR
jgi:sigma-E factor negative regulatory protein RseC